MKILHILTEKGWRGGEIQAFALCEGLKRRGLAIVATAVRGSQAAVKFGEYNIPCHELPGGRSYDLRTLIKLRSIIKREEPDLIHCHTAAAHSLALPAILKNRGYPDNPLLVSRRVDFPVATTPFSSWKYMHPRIVYIAISKGVKNVLRQAGIPVEKIHVVFSGIDSSRFDRPVKTRMDILEEAGIAPEAFIIGNVAALADHKGQRYLIDAMPAVMREIPHAILLIAGEGEERRNLEARIHAQGLEKNVVLLGYRNDIGDVIRAFDLFVLSSHLEGLCTSILDAMALNIPVVATDTGGVPDAVIDGETGVLIEPRNPDALSRAIIHACRNRPETQRMAENAKQRVEALFTLEHMVEKTLQVYQIILKQGGKNIAYEEKRS